MVHTARKFEQSIGPVPWLLGLVAVVLSVSVAMLLAYLNGVQTLEDQTRRVVDEILFRSHAVSEQFDNTALKVLLAQSSSAPCSTDSIETMRKLTISARSLRVLGYVKDNRLLCSAYGDHGEGLPLGPPGYTSKNGFEIRPQVRLAIAGDAQLLSTTHQASGFTALVAPGLISDVVPESPDASFGLFGATSQQLMFSRGPMKLPTAWFARAGVTTAAVTFQGEGRVVVMQRSPRYDYVAYAALPLAQMAREFRTTSLILVPLASMSGMAVAALIVVLARRRKSLLNMLRQALQRDELFVLYQPIVNLRTGRWVGAEALVRWRLPDGVLVPPDVFIEVAENNGLIRDLTARVIEISARDLATIVQSQPDFMLSINFSAQDFSTPDSVQRLSAALATWQLDPGHVSVEITERALVSVDEVRAGIRTLRDSGARIAIDDFGTGYSGLSYLTTLELDALKIDKHFVDTIGTDAVTKNVISHIIEIAKSMGLKMVAEGVETPDQASYLVAQGVQCAQGWLYAKALPLDALLAGLAAPPAAPAGV